MRSNREMSVAQYAKHRGCADRAVVVALQKGRISRTPDGWIDPVQADIDWAKNTNPRNSAANKRNGAIGQAMRRRREAVAQAGPAQSSADAPAAVAQPEFIVPPQPADVEQFARARAVRERYAALSIKLDYEERSAKLIDRREVETTAMMHGRILQEQILAVPDRLAAQLAAESDAAAIHHMLDAELRMVLEKVASMRRVLRTNADTSRAAVG